VEPQLTLLQLTKTLARSLRLTGATAPEELGARHLPHARGVPALRAGWLAGGGGGAHEGGGRKGVGAPAGGGGAAGRCVLFGGRCD
jgi:hypothetical protein